MQGAFYSLFQGVVSGYEIGYKIDKERLPLSQMELFFDDNGEDEGQRGGAYRYKLLLGRFMVMVVLMVMMVLMVMVVLVVMMMMFMLMMLVLMLMMVARAMGVFVLARIGVAKFLIFIDVSHSSNCLILVAKLST